MIGDVIFSVIGIIMTLLNYFLPTWTIWPQAFIDGLEYFAGAMAKLNFLFPIDTLFSVLTFLITFETLYFTSRIGSYVINFVRGRSSGGDII